MDLRDSLIALVLLLALLTPPTSAQDSASNRTPKAVQRGVDASTVSSLPIDNAVQFSGPTTNARLLYCNEKMRVGEHVYTAEEYTRLRGMKCEPGDPPPDPQEPSAVPMPGHKSHPKALVLSILGGAAIGASIALLTRKHCNHYEYGQSGVNVPCPREDHDGR